MALFEKEGIAEAAKKVRLRVYPDGNLVEMVGEAINQGAYEVIRGGKE